MRGRSRLLTAALLGSLAGLGLASDTAQAQECPSRAWPTTRFELRHQRATGDILDAVLSRPAAARRMIELLVNPVADPEHDPVFGDAVPVVDAAWARLVEDQLHDIAERLQAAGFRCPKIRTSGDDGELRYVAYLIDFDADPEQSVMDPARGRAYTEIHVPDSPYFLLNRANFNLATGEVEQGLYWTLAHEFFHMVQGTYDVAYGSVGMAHTGAGVDFVVEGGASGVATYLVSQRFPGYLEERESSRRRLGGYSYHFSLLDADKDSQLKNAYNTSSFWFHLAERFGLPVIEDLHRRRLAGHTLEQRVRWLDDGLRAGPHAKGGFGPVLAHFLTELASYGPGRRYSKVPEADWMKWIFAECGPSHRWTAPPAAVSYVIPGSALAGSQFLPLEAFDGGCVQVEWAGFPDSVAFQVEAAGPDAESLRQLQLGVAQTSFRPYRNCWSSRSPGTCLVEGASAPFQRDGMWYRTWELVPGEYGAAGDALLVFTNVDERAPWQTRPIYDLRITFRMLHEFAAMAGRGGPTPSDIDSPLAIELDDFRSDFVRPYPHPSLAHIPDPCVARFLFLNSETGEGVELNLDHSGPIGPGVYDISRGSTSSSFAPPENHPGSFTGAFGIVMGGPDVRLRRFFLHSGSVTIHSIAGRLVQGEVRANGWRNPYMDGSELGDDVSMEPTQATIQARFTLIASRHYPDQEESATGRRALECLTGESVTRGGRPPGPPPKAPEPPPDAPDPEPDAPDPEPDEPDPDPPPGRAVPPQAAGPGEEEQAEVSAAAPAPTPGARASEGVRTTTVSLEFFERERSGGDVRSMLGRAERRVDGAGTTISAENQSVGLTPPARVVASCELSGATPPGIDAIVRGRAFRAESLRMRWSPDGFALEIDAGDEEATVVLRAPGEPESQVERESARVVQTRYDARGATLEVRWPGGRVSCAEPLDVAFRLLETL